MNQPSDTSPAFLSLCVLLCAIATLLCYLPELRRATRSITNEMRGWHARLCVWGAGDASDLLDGASCPPSYSPPIVSSTPQNAESLESERVDSFDESPRTRDFRMYPLAADFARANAGELN